MERDGKGKKGERRELGGCCLQLLGGIIGPDTPSMW